MNTANIPENNDNNKPVKRPLIRRMSFWIVLLLIVVILAYAKHFGWLGSNHTHTKKPINVVLGTVKSADVPIYISALGTVTPTYNVTVKTQVNGTLLQVLFKEGQNVKAGDLLAQIDPRPYEATELQFQGQLLRDQALLANAKIDLVRYQNLWHENSVAQQTLATQAALVKQYEGTIEADQGQLNTAKVNLIYTRIISPINGRVGLRLVDPGNFVQTSDTTGIVVINTLDPITVIFPIPETDVPAVMKQINAGKTLTVEAYDRDQNKLLATGTLLTIDNQIDPTTGTVKLRAQFSNPNGSLFPNQFVNIQLLVDTLHNAVVIPTAAIQYNTTSPFVYLLNTDSTVSVKPVVVGVTYSSNTSVTGLIPGEAVVVEGADKLTDGADVTTSSAATTDKKQHKHTDKS